MGRRVMEMEVLGKRKRGRPKRRFLDIVKEDMGEIGVKKTGVEDRKNDDTLWLPLTEG